MIEDDPRIDPADLRNVRFPGNSRRYDAKAVDSFLDATAQRVIATNAMVDDLIRRLEVALREASSAGESVPPPVLGSLSDEELDALLGQETASVLTTARRAAEEIRSKAEESAARVIREATAEAKTTLDRAKDRVVELTAEAEHARDTAVDAASSEAERIRQDAERDAHHILAEAREKARVDLEAVEERARSLEDDAARVLAEAREQGRSMIAEAKEVRGRVLDDLQRRRDAARTQVERLLAGRDGLLGSLERVRSHLDQIDTELGDGAPVGADDAGPVSAVDDDAELIGDFADVDGADSLAVEAADVTSPDIDDTVADLAGDATPDGPPIDEDPMAPGLATDDTVAPHVRATLADASAGDDLALEETLSDETLPDDARSDDALSDDTLPVDVVQDDTGRDDTVALGGTDGVDPGDDAIEEPDSADDTVASVVEDLDPVGEPDRGVADADDAAEDRPDGSADAEPDDGVAGPSDDVSGSDDETERAAAVTAEDAGDDATADDRAGPEADGDVLDLAGMDRDQERRAMAAHPAAGGDVDALFARLRAERAESVAQARDVLDRADPGHAGDEAAHAADDAANAPAAKAGATAARSSSTTSVREEFDDVDRVPEQFLASGTALETRSAALGDLAKSLGRSLKRYLADEQNEALDSLRRTGATSVDDLYGPTDSHVAAVVTIVRDDLSGAASAGAAVVDPGAPPADVSEVAMSLAAGLVEPFRRRVASASSEVGGDADALDERLRALYREWKVQHVTPAVDDALLSAYGAGTRWAAPIGGVLRWLVDPGQGPCPDAQDNALAGGVAVGESFPTGDPCPQAHPGCRCLLVVDDT